MNYSSIGTSFSHNNGMEGEVVGLRVKTHWVRVKNGGQGGRREIDEVVDCGLIMT